MERALNRGDDGSGPENGFVTDDGVGDPAGPEAAPDFPLPGFSGGPPAIPLSQLIDELGPMSVHAAYLPDEPTPVIGDPVIYEYDEPLLERPASLLMAVGCRPSRPATLDTVREAGAGRYAAVIVKARGEDLAPVVAAAADADIALLVAPDELPWRDLDSLLTAAIAVAGPRRSSYASVGLGDLMALANEVAYRVGGALAIEDPNGHVLAYSNLPHQQIDGTRRGGILDRRPPSRPADVERYRAIRSARGVVRLRATIPGNANRLAVPVRAGEQLLGILWALDSDPPLGEEAETELMAAARITALHLLRVRSHADVDRWSRSQTLVSLLDGSMQFPMASTQLGIPADTATTVLAIADTSSSESPELAVARIVELAGLYCEAWHPQAVCAMSGTRVYALLPTRAGPAGERAVHKFAGDVAAIILRTASLTVNIGVGTLAPTLEQVPTSRTVADRVLAAVPAAGDDARIAGVGDVRSRVVLLELVERIREMAAIPYDPLARVIEHDRDHSTSYADTVLAFLDAFGDAPKAAKMLVVHENTLRYRIRRLPDMFDLDLEDPETRLVTWLQLALRRLDAAG